MTTDETPNSDKIRVRQAIMTKAFLDYLHDLWTELKEGRHPASGGRTRTLEEWGKELARLSNRKRPYLKGQLSKFLTGASTPVDIADAISEYFGLPSAVIAAESIEEIEWFLAGRALLKASPSDFRKLLRNAQARTRLEKEISEFEQQVTSNPEN